MELVLLVGLQGSGKTTFFRERFAATHEHVSKDNFRNNARPARRQRHLIAVAFAAGRSLVVDTGRRDTYDQEPTYRRDSTSCRKLYSSRSSSHPLTPASRATPR